MESKGESKKVIRFVLIIVLIIVLGIGAYTIFSLTRPVPTPTLRVEPASLSVERGPLYQLKAFYDSDGLGGKPEEEVTAKATWSQEDANIIWVSDNDPVKGQVLTRAVGSTTVLAVFSGITVRVPAEVTTGILELRCAPFPKTARVGETVRWWSLFTKVGVPFYIYAWSGSDGLKGPGPYVNKTYSSVGIKKAEISVVDMAGTQSHAYCETLEVK